MKRRHFLQASTLAAGGFLLRGVLAPAQAATAAAPGAVATADEVALNAWVRIGRDSTVTILLSQAEMGQGVATTLPAIIAEELGADWSRVTIENAPVDPAYVNPRTKSQFTGNAESVRTFFPLLRTMGAAARDMLIAAAARRWRVPAAACKAASSSVIHVPTGRRLAFGEVADAAARMRVPAAPALRSPADWALLGQPLPRVDIPAKVAGTAVFGIDFEVEGMVHAAVRQCPVFGGKVGSVDESSIAGMAGVLAVVAIPNGVAVAGSTYWQARRALDRLAVTWDEGAHAQLSSADLDAMYQGVLDGERWSTAVDQGDARGVVGEARAQGRVVAGEYVSAWQVHAPMEPMNCAARVTAEGCEIWGPTQGQSMVQSRVSQALGLARERVQVHRTYLGGGFGRRLIADYAVQAALVAKAVGRPVKVLWSREEDMQHSHYRPRVVHRVEAALGDDGLPGAFLHKLVSPSILSAVVSADIQFHYPKIDPSCVEGLRPMLYGVPANRLDVHMLPVPVPVMVWRTTGYGPNVFSLECFIDDLAHAAGRDPVEYRQALLARPGGHGDSQRALAVLARAVTAAGWPGDRGGRDGGGAGRYMGVAVAHAYDSYIAQVVEISLPAPDTIDIHRVVSAVDLGRVLDPGIARAGIEGGVAWGLSQCLSAEITFERGRVAQANFDDYRILALPEMPKTEVHFVDSGAAPGGLGELGPLAVAPALCNALRAATGKRYATLPLSRHGVYTRYAKQFI